MTLLVAGIALGNAILIYLSLVPFFFVFFSLAYRRAGYVAVTRAERVITASTSEVVRLSITADLGRSSGIVTVADRLPEHFVLDDGNNFHVFWSDGKSQPVTLFYAVRCTRRGAYDIGPAHVERFYSSWMGRIPAEAGEMARLTVKPARPGLKKMRDPRLRSSLPLPLGAACKLGMRTTDFQEIRHYSYGDSYRAINWKATARLSTAVNAKPYVNEYEKEGKKTVLIFIDAGTWMSLGSTVDNVLEYALQAASGISSFYLERDVRVGVYVYNYGEFILPDTGRQQASRILRSLIDVEIVNCVDGDGLKRAVKRCSGHLAGVNPLFVVITMIGNRNARDLIEGVRLMHRYSYNAKRPQVFVLHVAGYGLAASDLYEKAGAILLEAGDMPCVRAVRKAGALVIPWNPLTKSLSRVMAVGFRRRS
jgi:uncharacterized protein (DUF58 family)